MNAQELYEILTGLYDVPEWITDELERHYRLWDVLKDLAERYEEDDEGCPTCPCDDVDDYTNGYEKGFEKGFEKGADFALQRAGDAIGKVLGGGDDR